MDSYLAAIATVHRYHGHAIDRTILIEPLKAARRRAGPQRRARALVAADLKKVVAGLDPDIPRDARDATILLLGFAAALRGSEVTGLDWQRTGGRHLGGTGVLSQERDGLLVTLTTSKGSQITPVTLAVLRPVDRHQNVLPARLAPDAVAKIIKRRALSHAKATGLPEADAFALAWQYSSHSLRRGYCSSASEKRLSLGEIRRRSRHCSDAVLGKYIRDAEGWRSSGLGKVGF
jgi:integrase